MINEISKLNIQNNNALELAKFISHKIESPLVTLEILTLNMNTLSSEQITLVKLAIKEIRAISKDLKEKINNIKSSKEFEK